MRTILLIIAVFVVGITLAVRTQEWHDAFVITRCLPGIGLTLAQSPASAASTQCTYQVASVGRDLVSGDYVFRQGKTELHVPGDDSIAIAVDGRDSGFTVATWVVGIVMLILMPAIPLWELLVPSRKRRGTGAPDRGWVPETAGT